MRNQAMAALTLFLLVVVETGALGQGLVMVSPRIGTAVGYGAADFADADSLEARIRDGSTGAVLLTMPNPTASGGFGKSISARGTDLLVGSYGVNEAYIFDVGAGGTLAHTLVPDPGSGLPDALFGWAVELAGPYAVVGAQGANAGLPGAVHVFDASTGTFVHGFVGPASEPGDEFGSSITALGDDVIVADPERRLAYRMDPATGATLQTYAPVGPGSSEFGRSTSLNDELIAVSGSHVFVASRLDGVVFQFDADTGSQIRRFENPYPSGLISSLAAGNGFLAVGDSEIVHLFDVLTGVPVRTIVQNVRTDSLAWAGGNLAMSPNSFFAPNLLITGGCGDGLLDPGEVCDDGNAIDGDCCSSTCEAEVPFAGCRTPVSGPSGLLLLRDKDPFDYDSGDQVAWKWSKGTATALADFGDPLTTDGYRVCIYDESAPAVTVAFAAAIPAGGTCGSKPCWKALGTKGFSFTDKSGLPDQAGLPDGVQKLVLKAGDDGRAKIILKAKNVTMAVRPGWPPAFPLSVPLRVQLRADNGECWESTVSSAGLIQSDAIQFKGKAD